MHPALCSIVIPPRSLGICDSALHPVCNVGTVGLGDRPICFRIPISLFHLSFECHCHHPFVQAACSTTRRTTRHTASQPAITCPSLSPPRQLLAPQLPPAPRPPPPPLGAARGRQTVAPRRLWTGCRTARKVGTSSRPTTIGRRQSWSWKPWVPVEAGVRGAHAIQDFKTSACSSQAPHLPSSPSPEGILTLKSFIIPYLKLGDLPSDIAGGLTVISYSISWSKSCLIS